MKKNVGLYARISEDPDDVREGVDRQVEDGRLIATARDWEVARVYIDNDLSAYKRKVVRPDFEQMLTDLQAGVIDGIVAYDLDRFVRQPRDLERAIDIYETRTGLVFATVQGDVNLQTADGRTMARVMVAFANKSSADTGRRVARKHLENARKGKPVGGYRPFGWEDDKATIRESEARLARQAVADVIAGKTTGSIAARWNAEGVTTTVGNPWSYRTVRQYLLQPRLVGYRVHRGEILLDAHGKPVEGQWEPLIDPLTWDRLQAVFSRPDKRTRIPRRNARRYLLTGLVRCGKCNGLMYGNVQYNDRHYYTCEGSHRPMMTVSGVGVDRLIGKLIVAKLSSESVEPEASGEWEREAELVQAQEKVDQLMTAFLDSKLSEDVVFPRVQALELEIAEMKNDRQAWLATTLGPVVHSMSGEDWEAMPVDDRRAYAEQLLSAVLIKPVTRLLGNRLDPERVVPVWRQREGRQSPLVAVE